MKSYSRYAERMLDHFEEDVPLLEAFDSVSRRLDTTMAASRELAALISGRGSSEDGALLLSRLQVLMARLSARVTSLAATTSDAELSESILVLSRRIRTFADEKLPVQ